MPYKDEPLFIDLSSYQGLVNWKIIANHKDPEIIGAAIRAGISWGYRDSFFNQNWKEAKLHRVPRTAYHVLYPKEDPIRQMKHFFTIVGEDYGELPMILDIELSHGATPKDWQNCIILSARYIRERTGRYPILYSRANFIDQLVTGPGNTPPAWYKDFWWHLAHYHWTNLIEHSGPPPMPKGAPKEKGLLHQTWQKGTPIGVSSRSLDYNRLLVSRQVYDSLIITDTPPVVEEPPIVEEPPVVPEQPPVISKPVTPLYSVITTGHLNVRKGPSIENERLGTLINGTSVPVVEESENWIRLDGWIHKNWTKKVK